MSQKYSLGTLDVLRNKIIDLSLITFSVFGILIHTLVIYRTLKTGFSTAFYVQTAVIISLCIITLYRKKLSLAFKNYFLVAVATLVVIAGLYSSGFYASSKIYVALLPVLISFLMPARQAIYALILLSFTYMIFAWLYISGTLTYDGFIEDYNASLLAWLLDGFTIIMTAWALLLIGIYFNKTLRKRIIELNRNNIHLSNNQTKYQKLFESANDAITLLEDGRFTDCNKKACEYFMLSKEEILGKTPWELSPEFQPDGTLSEKKAKDMVQQAFQDNFQSFEWQHLRSNGEIIDVDITLSSIKLDDKTYIQGILRDVTEQKKNQKELQQYRDHLEQLVKEKTEDIDATNQELRATNEELHATLNELKATQSQLIQSEKMASLGVLTAGVAHEINNPLNYIMGGYLGLENYFENHPSKQPEDTNVLLNSIKTGVDRASEIVKGLNQFSRDQKNFKEECYIHEIIENCLSILRSKYKQRVEIRNMFSEEDLVVTGNNGKLHQVFLNILTNAIQAIEDEGTVTIQTSSDKGKVNVSIHDTGTGIAKEHLTKITDPFFTTKNPGEGTGLGLSIAYEIIQKHNGSITISSEKNAGTTVNIELSE